MNPQVRETEPSPVAAPLTPVATGLVGAIQIAKPAVEIKAPASDPQVDHGPSLLDKRRRRRARLSNRH
ncbi:MAG: hypothetical protein QNI84_13880 [Henriciella sp.]|nr:hypothetical protein [Henriciella sp.]